MSMAFFIRNPRYGLNLKSCKILIVNSELRKKRALEIIVFLIIMDIKKAKEPGAFS